MSRTYNEKSGNFLRKDTNFIPAMQWSEKRHLDNLKRTPGYRQTTRRLNTKLAISLSRKTHFQKKAQTSLLQCALIEQENSMCHKTNQEKIPNWKIPLHGLHPNKLK